MAETDHNSPVHSSSPWGNSYASVTKMSKFLKVSNFLPKFLTKQLIAKIAEYLRSTAVAHSLAFFSVEPRVVLVMEYMAEFRFHNPICNSAEHRACQRCLLSLSITPPSGFF